MSDPFPVSVDPNALTLPALYARVRESAMLRRLLDLARDEDFGGAGDVTSKACLGTDRVEADLRARAVPGIAAGIAAGADILKVVGPHCEWTAKAEDGSPFGAGDTLATIRGPLTSILGAERVLVNLISRLCAVATHTRRFVDRVPKGSPVRVCDTRKTTPGLRVLEKYAVRCGGGWSHRWGLYDAVLIKDNHTAGVKAEEFGAWIAHAAARVRMFAPSGLRFFEIEVDTLEQFESVLQSQASAARNSVIDVVLLDNMQAPMLARAVEMRNNVKSPLLLEASGGIGLDTVADIAATGVDRVSVGAITHGPPPIDLGLDIRA